MQTHAESAMDNGAHSSRRFLCRARTRRTDGHTSAEVTETTDDYIPTARLAPVWIRNSNPIFRKCLEDDVRINLE